MDDVIASQKIWGQRAGAEPFEIEIRIGKPYLVDEGQEEWACHASLAPLYPNLVPTHGASSFQALCQASASVLNLLQGFREKGGALSYSPGDDFEFGPFSFGNSEPSRGA